MAMPIIIIDLVGVTLLCKLDKLIRTCSNGHTGHIESIHVNAFGGRHAQICSHKTT